MSGLLTTGVLAAIVTASYPLYLHYLGYERYGVWLVLTTVLGFAMLTNLGIAPAVTHFVAEDLGREDFASIEGTVNTAMAVLVGLGSLATVAIMMFRHEIISVFRLEGTDARMAMQLLPYVGLLSVYVFIVQATGAILSGLGRIDQANYGSVTGRIVSVVGSVVLLAAGLDVRGLLIASYAAYIIEHSIYLILIRRSSRLRLWRLWAVDVGKARQILTFGGNLTGASLLRLLLQPFNRLVISRYLGVSTVPIYEIAYNVAMYSRSIIEAGLRALMPEISRLTGSQETVSRRISQIYARAMTLAILTGFVMLGAIFVVAKPLLHVWLQERFDPLLPSALRITLLGAYASLIGVPAYYTIIGLGYAGKILLSEVAQSLLNATVVLLVIALWPPLSLHKVVTAGAVGMTASTIYLVWQCRSLLQRQTYREPVLRDEVQGSGV